MFPVGLIVGIVLGALFGLVLIIGGIVLAFFLIRRSQIKRQPLEKKSMPQEDSEKLRQEIIPPYVVVSPEEKTVKEVP